MVSLLMKNEIIVLHRQGKSSREISRRIGISRNTTNKYVKEANGLFILTGSQENNLKKGIESMAGRVAVVAENHKEIQQLSLLIKGRFIAFFFMPLWKVRMFKS